MLGCQVFGVVRRCGHSRECATAGKNEFALAVILEGLAPRGVGVQVVEDHDVAVAKAGDEGKMACLVRVHCVLQIDDPDEDIMCNNVCSWHKVMTGTVVLGGFAFLMVLGASTGQVDWTPWHCPCM